MNPIKIGNAAAPSFDEPLEMLAACHQRIEAMLDTLERLARHLESSGNDSLARVAAHAVLRYFDTAGALHHRDEDHDLFPLLRVRAGELARDEVAAVIDELEREHHTMEAQWQRLRESLLRVADGAAQLDPDEVTRFAWLNPRHMQQEGAAVMPFAREALKADERAALGRRMAARRTAP
jgi:hemerythrin-like domain-containing protein